MVPHTVLPLPGLTVWVPSPTPVQFLTLPPPDFSFLWLSLSVQTLLRMWCSVQGAGIQTGSELHRSQRDSPPLRSTPPVHREAESQVDFDSHGTVSAQAKLVS